MRAASLLVLAIAGFPAGALGAVYTCTDADGRTVFRDTPCPRGERMERPAATQKAAKSKRSSTTSLDAPLDRKQVDRVVAAFDKAMRKRDPKAVTALLAKDAEVEMRASGSGEGTPMTRKEFAAYLAAAFAHPRYVYEAQSPRVSLSKKQPSATVNRTVREAVLVGGNAIVTDLRERLTVERDGKRLVIRKLRKAPPDRAA
jgi:Domain of unknown function (DUF4124)